MILFCARVRDRLLLSATAFTLRIRQLRLGQHKGTRYTFRRLQ